MKLYTRTGDDGTTGLFGGDRVPKDDPRVAAYGDVDELNAALGVAAAIAQPDTGLHTIVTAMQSRLFDVGADLATPHDSKHADKITRIDQSHIEQAEQWIDQVDGQNQPMTSFILPGGTDLAARLHLARAIARRAERSIITLARTQTINESTIIFINRISDLLFAMARRANAIADVTDIPWKPATPTVP